MTKFRVVMKDPDGIYDAIEEAAVDEVDKIRGLSQAERVQLVLARRNAIELDCEHWFERGEYVELEVDTEAGTCIVVPNETKAPHVTGPT